MDRDTEYLLDISRTLRKQFQRFSSAQKPDEDFERIAGQLFASEDENSVDIVIGLLERILEEPNLHYFLHIVQNYRNKVQEWGFYLIAPLNTGLQLLLEQNMISEAFLVLKILAPQADARTLEILQHFSQTSKNTEALKRILPFRRKLEKKIASCLRSIERMRFEEPVSFFEQWQE